MDNNTNVPEVLSGEHQCGDLHYLIPFNPGEATGEEVEALWHQLASVENAWDDFTRGNIQYFFAMLCSGNARHWRMQNFGFATVRNIVPTLSADMHYSIWKDVGSIRVYRTLEELITFLFDKFKLKRITALLPAYAESAERLAELLGFQLEGTIRDAIINHGEYHDIKFYGLLREEWECRH